MRCVGGGSCNSSISGRWDFMAELWVFFLLFFFILIFSDGQRAREREGEGEKGGEKERKRERGKDMYSIQHTHITTRAKSNSLDKPPYTTIT